MPVPRPQPGTVAGSFLPRASAASENYGNFFAQNVFMGASGTLLIASTMAEQGYAEVNALNVAMWSIPIAVISVLLGIANNFLLDKKLAATLGGKKES